MTNPSPCPGCDAEEHVTECTIYTPDRVAEVEELVRLLDSRLGGDLEPWEREQVEDSLADARAWLQEAERLG